MSPSLCITHSLTGRGGVGHRGATKDSEVTCPHLPGGTGGQRAHREHTPLQGAMHVRAERGRSNAQQHAGGCSLHLVQFTTLCGAMRCAVSCCAPPALEPVQPSAACMQVDLRKRRNQCPSAHSGHHKRTALLRHGSSLLSETVAPYSARSLLVKKERHMRNGRETLRRLLEPGTTQLSHTHPSLTLCHS